MMLQENPAATFKEMLDWAQNNHLPKSCIGTLHNHLETEVITRKQLYFHPQERNSERIKIMTSDQQFTFVFIDEFSFNLSNQLRMGRSKRHQLSSLKMYKISLLFMIATIFFFLILLTVLCSNSLKKYSMTLKIGLILCLQPQKNSNTC